jgi:Flp pilus assembly protein TadG
MRTFDYRRIAAAMPPRLLKGRRGQSVVEFALSVPLLIVLLLAAVEFGQIFYTQISVINAARAGVQYGAQNITSAGDASGMQQAALADAPNIAGLTATATHFCQCANGSASTCLATDCSGSHRLLFVQVNTSAVYTPMMSYPGVPGSMTLTGQATMRVPQ